MTESTPLVGAIQNNINDNGSFSARALLLILFQLMLVILVVREFEIEKSRGLAELLYLVLGGFTLYAFVPMRFRLILFLCYSLLVCILVIGWENTAWTWGIGCALLSICHLPMRLSLRAGLLLISAAGLAYFRVIQEMPFWPVLGSMFMFRLLVYLREREHVHSKAPITMQLSYFFMLPNACFPFFPIVDYRTFRESWFNEPADQVAQRGVHWIARGLIQLLLYRGIKYYLLPSPEEIHTVSDVALFLATNYMLYLRVSGSFHLITGILHLFGFNLPRTHDNYFLASSFTDIWRRINIYWKVFLERQFFYPAFFRLRRFGAQTALISSISIVFVVTWFMHSYQVFWLVGEFPVSLNEAALWLLAGVVVVVNTLVDFHSDRPKKKLNTTSVLFAAVRHSLQVVGVFISVSIFWACWTVPGFIQGLMLLISNSEIFWSDVWWLVSVVFIVITVGVIVQLIGNGFQPNRKFERLREQETFRTAAFNVGMMLLLLIVGTPWFANAFDLKTREKIVNMQREMQTAAEMSREVQGYYEQLANVNSQADPLVGARHSSTSNNAEIFMELTRPREDLLNVELIPGWKGILAGSPLTINNYGMRNRPISKRKPPNTYRIAMMGSSITMGYGVKDDETYARLLEEKFNAAMSKEGPRVEVLNFAIGQYYALHQAGALRTKIFDFEPDAIYFVAHQGEFYGPPRHVAEYWFRGHHLLYPCIDKLMQQSGITRQTPQGVVENMLQQKTVELTTCIYSGICDDCRQKGILPVWIYLPVPDVFEKTATAEEFVGAAKLAGFDIIDVRNWANGQNSRELKLSPVDYHLNSIGHALAAEAIWKEIRQQNLPPLNGLMRQDGTSNTKVLTRYNEPAAGKY